MNIPTERFEELDRVRQDGGSNMFDRNGVQVVANKLGFYALVILLENHKREYGQILQQFGEWKQAQE